MKPTKIIVEGLDRLGKDTIIAGIQEEIGPYFEIHFSKPKKLKHIDRPDWAKVYQELSFKNGMALLGSSEAKIIFNRFHLGECVYSPLYRNYSGEYVFGLERVYGLDRYDDIRLILLTEDFSKSTHFVDDGLSLGNQEAREKEQDMFVAAFNASIIADRRIICVTAENGSFRSAEDILKEALY